VLSFLLDYNIQGKWFYVLYCIVDLKGNGFDYSLNLK